MKSLEPAKISGLIYFANAKAVKLGRGQKTDIRFSPYWFCGGDLANRSSGWRGECGFGIPCNLYFVSLFVLILYATYMILNIVPFLKDWYGVEFSVSISWSMDYMVLMGLNIHNGKNVELEECRADLLSYYSDFQIEHNFPAIVGYFSDGAMLPLNLYWFVGKNLKYKDTIGIGRDGYIAIVFPLTKQESDMVVGKEHIYKIRGIGLELQNPIDDKGYLEVRISAKGMESIIKILKLEIVNRSLSLNIVQNNEEIKKIRAMNELVRKNNKETKNPA